MSTDAIPTILDIQDKAVVLPDRPQFWTSHHMAEFYRTNPRNLVRQFRRNPERFPSDFWFELKEEEKTVLVGQFGAPNRVNRGVLIGFTHSGALALSGVLKTPIADMVSVQIIRAVTAMEQQAIADANAMVGKLRTDTLRKKAIYVLIETGMRQGLSFDDMWRASSYAKWKLEKAAHELLSMRIISHLPMGMQAGLFDHG